MTALINNFIDFVIELIMFVWPEISLSEEVLAHLDAYLSLAIDLLKKINFLIPVPLIFECLIIMVTFKVAMFALWAVNWVIKRVFDVIP